MGRFGMKGLKGLKEAARDRKAERNIRRDDRINRRTDLQIRRRTM